MSARELERKLREMGFWLKKKCKKHDLWTNGTNIVTMSRGNSYAPHNARNVLAQARRRH